MTGPIRLVLADDTEPLRMLLRRIFESDDRFEVVGEAGDGTEALEQVKTLQPDLLLLDLSMPRMDGLEVLDRLRPTDQSTRVIVLSGHAADAAAKASLERGALAYIEKGVKPLELLATVAEIMEAADADTFTPLTIRSDGGSATSADTAPADAARRPDAGRDRVTPDTTAPDAAATPHARLEPPEREPSLDSLVSQLVHDLRSPLGLAVGYLDLLRRQNLDREPAVLLDRITMAMSHLDELVTTLGSYARVGRTPLDLGTVSVADVAAATIARLRDHHGDPLDYLTVDVGATTVHGDPTALHEVLFQLLDNAVRYGNEEPIAVRARSGDDAVMIEVVDHGPGLADDDADALFGPFRRGMAARGNWGTGLGLPLTARLVAAMGGRIWASNGVAGGGSVFTVELPAGRYREAAQSD